MTRLIVDDGGSRRAFKLNDGRLSVGSGSGATLRLSAEGVAEMHADLLVEGGKVRLAPRPGVKPPRVGGAAVEAEVELGHDVPVTIGGATLTVQYEDAPPPEPAAPAAPTPVVSRSSSRRPSARRAGAGAGRSRRGAGAGSRDARSAAGPARRSSSGLPGWLLAVIAVVVVGLGVFFASKVLTTETNTGTSVHGAMVVARKALAEGNLEMVRQRIEDVDVGKLDPATRTEYDAVRKEYEAAKAAAELQLVNAQGSVFLEQQLKAFEANRLRGKAERPEARVFVKRCKEFEKRWPHHPQLDWVKRMEARFAPIAQLDQPPTFADVDFESTALTWANPRDYRTAIPLLQHFADEQASFEERPKALAKIDQMLKDRQAWFDDKMEQARFEYKHGNEGKSVEWLRILIVDSGDADMAKEAAEQLVLFPDLVERLEAYKNNRPDDYAELVADPVVAEYVRTHPVP